MLGQANQAEPESFPIEVADSGFDVDQSPPGTPGSETAVDQRSPQASASLISGGRREGCALPARRTPRGPIPALATA